MAVKKFTDETYGMGPIPVAYSDSPGSGSFRSQELNALGKRKIDFDAADQDVKLAKWKSDKLSGLTQVLAMLNQTKNPNASGPGSQMGQLQDLLFKLNTYSPQDLRTMMLKERYENIPGYGK